MKMPMVLSGLLALAAAAFAAELGVARPGGVFRTAVVSHADACQQLCARDELCMAWTYETPTQACELKAVVPGATPSADAISGVMNRAGAFAEAVAPQAPSPDPAPTPKPEEAVIPTVAARSVDADADEELLGGDDDLGLRARLSDES